LLCAAGVSSATSTPTISESSSAIVVHARGACEGLGAPNVLAPPTCTTTASRSATCRGRGWRRSECSGMCDVVWCTIHVRRAEHGAVFQEFAEPHPPCGGVCVVRRGCEQRDFHAHDKRVFERDRGARTRSVRCLVLHQTCWLRQHAPRRRRETRLVVGVETAISARWRASLTCFACPSTRASRRACCFERAALAKCPNNRAFVFVIADVSKRLDVVLAISNFFQTGTLAPNDARDIGTDRFGGPSLCKPNQLLGGVEVKLSQSMNMIGHHSQAKQVDIARKKFLDKQR
jgi:hypothetical protein